MNRSGSIQLSCAPHWDHPDTDNSATEVDRRRSIPWRDHCKQGCFYLNIVTAFHDESSWWFDIRKEADSNLAIDRPKCSELCWFHDANSRHRIMQMNHIVDHVKIFSGPTLYVGDHNLQSLMQIQTEEPIYVLPEAQGLVSTLNFINFNNSSVKVISDINEIGENIVTATVAEPYYYNSVLPCGNIVKFRKQFSEFKAYLRGNFAVFPQTTSIHDVPVKFLDLHKIRDLLVQPVKTSVMSSSIRTTKSHL